MSDEKPVEFQPKFDPEKAKRDTIVSLEMAAMTCATNVGELEKIVMKTMDAPTPGHARAFIKMMGHALLMLAAEISSTDASEVKDAAPLVEMAQQKVKGKAH